ncbi:MAG: OmpA family protein [Brumimicrobium sp.]
MILLILKGSFLFGQKADHHSENIADCYGAIEIPINETIHPTFTGFAGAVNDLKKWGDSLKLNTYNSLWLNFKAKFDGEFTLDGKLELAPIELLIFKLEGNESCSNIHDGNTKVAHMKLYAEPTTSTVVPNISLKKNQSVLIYINTTQDTKENITLISTFEAKNKSEAYKSLINEKDFRSEVTTPSFHIKIRDAETNLPVESRVIISESKNFNALYKASDMVFPRSGYLRFRMKIDAEGYFFQDVNVNVRDKTKSELIIPMKPIEKNQQIELEGIQFLPQSKIFTEGAKPKLRRLRDFLALNRTVNIEIHGHVHKTGKNNWEAKRLSKKRAEKVKDYLVENGIDKSRISTEGFGNSKMKIPDAETDEEKSANRRVEIKIK